MRCVGDRCQECGVTFSLQILRLRMVGFLRIMRLFNQHAPY
jgi:hypothetical protein